MNSDSWTDDDEETREAEANTLAGQLLRLRFALDECKRAFMSGWRHAVERRKRDASS